VGFGDCKNETVPFSSWMTYKVTRPGFSIVCYSIVRFTVVCLFSLC